LPTTIRPPTIEAYVELGAWELSSRRYNTRTVRLHHLTQAAHDEALTYLCDELSATATLFAATDLKLVYRVGSSKIPRDQEF
jgi:hypothetical protein